MPLLREKSIRQTPAFAVAAFMAVAAFAAPAGACGWGGENEYDDDIEVIDVGADGKAIGTPIVGKEPSLDRDRAGEDPARQTRLGDRYRTGVGAVRDYAAALGWYRLAAEQGYAPAQNNIGNMYELGLGVAADPAEAAKWYALAAAEDEGHAQHSLGLLFRDGRGVSRDLDKAAALIGKAAEQGHAGAYTDLAGLYWDGAGLPRDRVQAYKWCRIAALAGEKTQLPPCNGAAAAMGRAEIAAAEALAETWQPTAPRRGSRAR